jgi:hypothetical protein
MGPRSENRDDVDFIERIVKLRMKQDEAKAAAKRKKSQTARKSRESK